MGKRNSGWGKHRVDINQKEIVDALVAAGASVAKLDRLGQGVPDLLVAYDGLNHLLEVKNPDNWYGKRGLNPLQQKWADAWKGAPVVIVRSINEALAAVGISAKVSNA